MATLASRLPLFRLGLLIGAAAWAQNAADEHVGRRQGLEARRFSLVDPLCDCVCCNPTRTAQDASPPPSLRIETIASLVAPAAAAAASLAVCFTSFVRSPLS